MLMMDAIDAVAYQVWAKRRYLKVPRSYTVTARKNVGCPVTVERKADIALH